MDCLVTKLKGVIKDDSLEKLGVIRLRLNAGTASSSFQSSGGISVMKVISGNVSIADYNTGVAQTFPYVIPDTTSWRTMSVGEGGAVVEIDNKYSLKSIKVIEKLLPHTDIKTCSYLSSLTEINSALNPSDSLNLGFVGDLADIIGYESLTALYWRSLECTGNIAECGRMLKLEQIHIYGGSVYGSLESLVAAYRENGRISGQLFFNWIPESITFNGVSAFLKENSTLTWTATTITWNGTTIDA